MKKSIASLTLLVGAASTFTLDSKNAYSQSILDWETIQVVNRTGKTGCSLFEDC